MILTLDGGPVDLFVPMGNGSLQLTIGIEEKIGEMSWLLQIDPGDPSHAFLTFHNVRGSDLGPEEPIMIWKTTDGFDIVLQTRLNILPNKTRAIFFSLYKRISGKPVSVNIPTDKVVIEKEAKDGV